MINVTTTIWPYNADFQEYTYSVLICEFVIMVEFMDKYKNYNKKSAF